MKHRFTVAEGDKMDFHQQKRHDMVVGHRAQKRLQLFVHSWHHQKPFSFSICDNVKIYKRAI